MAQLSRIDARIPLVLRETIDFAASLEGRTRTDFLITAVAEKAAKVIADHQAIRLSLRDQKMLALALADEAVREPDDFLNDLGLEYKDKVRVK